MKILKDLRTYFVLLLIGFVCWFTYQMVVHPILPNQYLIAVLVVLFVISGLLILVQYKANKTGRIIGKIGIVLLCIALCIVNVTYVKTVNLFDSIEHTEEMDVVSVVVMDNSYYNSIEDLDGKKFGVLDHSDTYVLDTIEEISCEENVVLYTDISLLIQDLFDGKIDCILLNEAYRGIIEESFEIFTDDTRVIYTKEYVTVIEEEEEEEVVEETESYTFIDFADVTYNENVDVTQDTFSIYVSGIDTYGTISTKSRSDVNMIVTVDPVNKKILLTSIPRDYYVPFQVLNGARDKLTHSGLYGVNETKRNVSNYFGVSLPYYVRVNFSSLVNIVDAIGGIDIYNPHTCFDLPVGEAHLDGKMALVYARERYSFSEGDKERGRNQMRVITGIINKVTSPEILTNYMPLLESLKSTFQTNLTDAQLLSLIRMQLNDMRSWSIESISVNGRGDMLYSPIYGSTLYMCVPDDSTVVAARDKIASMYR